MITKYFWGCGDACWEKEKRKKKKLVSQLYLLILLIRVQILGVTYLGT